MDMDLLTVRTVEVSPAGLLKYGKEIVRYRRVAPGIKQGVQAVLDSRDLPVCFTGCARAVLSFCFADSCDIGEILVRRPGNNWIYLMDIEITSDAYVQLGARSVPNLIVLLLTKALDLSQGAVPVRRAALVKELRGSDPAVDVFLSKLKKKSAKLEEAPEFELVFSCLPGLGTAADLDLRHRIEEVLEEALIASGQGEVTGGSIGGGEMEVHLAMKSASNAKRLLRRLLREYGFPPPKRIDRLT